MNMKIRPQLLQPTKSYANHTPPLKAVCWTAAWV